MSLIDANANRMKVPIAVFSLLLLIFGNVVVHAQNKPVQVSAAEAEKLLIKPEMLPLRPAFRGTGFPAHLEFTVLPNGSVTNISDLDNNPLNPANGEPKTIQGVSAKNAENAVAQWKFHPYLKDGLPAAIRVKVNFEYQGEWKVIFK